MLSDNLTNEIIKMCFIAAYTGTFRCHGICRRARNSRLWGMIHFQTVSVCLFLFSIEFMLTVIYIAFILSWPVSLFVKHSCLVGMHSFLSVDCCIWLSDWSETTIFLPILPLSFCLVFATLKHTCRLAITTGLCS